MRTTVLTVDLEAFGAATAPGISSPPETVHPPWLAPIAWVPFG